MSTLKINTGRQLKVVLDQLFETNIKASLYKKSLAEKENQLATVTDLFGEAESANETDDNTAKSPDPDTKALESGGVTVESIIEKLNAIRSGKSFKEDVVRHAMDVYVESLKKPERVALLAFLKGIAQIVTGEIPGQQALDPSDPEPSIKMKKGSGVNDDKTNQNSRHRSIKPNIIKREGPSIAKKSIEDTTAPTPVPITPKRK